MNKPLRSLGLLRIIIHVHDKPADTDVEMSSTLPAEHVQSYPNDECRGSPQPFLRQPRGDSTPWLHLHRDQIFWRINSATDTIHVPAWLGYGSILKNPLIRSPRVAAVWNGNISWIWQHGSHSETHFFFLAMTVSVQICNLSALLEKSLSWMFFSL